MKSTIFSYDNLKTIIFVDYWIPQAFGEDRGGKGWQRGGLVHWPGRSMPELYSLKPQFDIFVGTWSYSSSWFRRLFFSLMQHFCAEVLENVIYGVFIHCSFGTRYLMNCIEEYILQNVQARRVRESELLKSKYPRDLFFCCMLNRLFYCGLFFIRFTSKTAFTYYLTDSHISALCSKSLYSQQMPAILDIGQGLYS